MTDLNSDDQDERWLNSLIRRGFPRRGDDADSERIWARIAKEMHFTEELTRQSPWRLGRWAIASAVAAALAATILLRVVPGPQSSDDVTLGPEIASVLQAYELERDRVATWLSSERPEAVPESARVLRALDRAIEDSLQQLSQGEATHEAVRRLLGYLRWRNQILTDLTRSSYTSNEWKNLS
ncbi:MAG: hypothetical protein ACE5GX_11545 [Thermoanaerobaculia bacterium]